MAKEKDGFGGISNDEAYAPERMVGFNDPDTEANAKQALNEIKTRLQNPGTGCPLLPISSESLVQLRRLIEMIRDDDWIAANAIIVCFDNTNGNRHVALGLARDINYWRFDQAAKRHLQTARITVYDPRTYTQIVLREIEKEIN